MSAPARVVPARAVPARVMILAGGTGGHIFPGLAVARALRARGADVTWLGADGQMETRLVPQHDIAIDTIAVKGLRGKGIATLVGAPIRVLNAVRAAARVVTQRRPRAVISFGGYAAGPGGVAAKLAGVPLLVHEQNRAPGFTNRVLARVARRVLTGFPQTFKASVIEEVVGNPVRDEIASVQAPQLRMGRGNHRMRLLVLGGSQGARALNAAVPKALQALGDASIEVRHQCGEKMRADAEAAYAQAGIAASVEPFIADMAAAYAWADIVVCRAGALTLAELCAAGVGSVLVPFPQAVDDHQTRNAEYLVERGAAVLLPQNDALADRLRDVLRTLRADAGKRMKMAEAARSIARPDAAARVADIVLEEIARFDAVHREAA
jgi:UDP-N-acetylglucosamine--N-acetylmuramyl-(pentapeptide) pyrophosphoryl-undecaprenol N-acetylglucosamine transferase